MPLSDDPRRPANTGSTTGSLSPNFCRLLNRMRHLRYGTISGQHVRAGDPHFDPPPTVVCSVRLAEAGTPRREPAGNEFQLKREHIALQQQLAAIGTGVIDVIKVHDGLPMVLEFREQL